MRPHAGEGRKRGAGFLQWFARLLGPRWFLFPIVLLGGIVVAAMAGQRTGEWTAALWGGLGIMGIGVMGLMLWPLFRVMAALTTLTAYLVLMIGMCVAFLESRGLSFGEPIVLPRIQLLRELSRKVQSSLQPVMGPPTTERNTTLQEDFVFRMQDRAQGTSR